jgi:hypothetical protein
MSSLRALSESFAAMSGMLAPPVPGSSSNRSPICSISSTNSTSSSGRRHLRISYEALAGYFGVSVWRSGSRGATLGVT